MPAPKTPPDLLRTTSVKARPSAWPPRDRRPARPSRPAHTGLPRLPRPSPVSADAGRGWAKSSHARWPPFVPVQDAPLAGTTVCEPRELRQAAKRGVRRFGYSEKARFVLLSRLWPPASRDHGLQLRLKSAASSRLPLSRFCRANLEPWAIVPFVRAVRSREVNTSGPSPRVQLTGPQSGSFGRGASPPRLSFRPPAAQPGCRPPSDSKF